MDHPSPSPQGRGLTAIDRAIALIAILLVVQVWLLMATLNTFLVGDRAAVLPAAVVSAVMFVACLVLYLFVDRLDASVRRPAEIERTTE